MSITVGIVLSVSKETEKN